MGFAFIIITFCFVFCVFSGQVWRTAGGREGFRLSEHSLCVMLRKCSLC